MGIARTRPSRIIKEVSFDVSLLPGAVSASTTVYARGLPQRGILHNISLLAQDGAAIDATTYNTLILSSAGTVTSGSGDSTLSTALIDGAFFMAAWKENDSKEGALDTDRSGDLFASQIQIVGGAQGGTVAYDVGSSTLGPDSNDGTIYIAIVGGVAMTDLTSLKVRLEIEPCY